MPTAAAVWVAWAAWRCDGCASANPNATSTRTPIRVQFKQEAPLYAGLLVFADRLAGMASSTCAHTAFRTSVPVRRARSGADVIRGCGCGSQIGVPFRRHDGSGAMSHDGRTMAHNVDHRTRGVLAWMRSRCYPSSHPLAEANAGLTQLKTRHRTAPQQGRFVRGATAVNAW